MRTTEQKQPAQAPGNPWKVEKGRNQYEIAGNTLKNKRICENTMCQPEIGGKT